MIRPIDNLYIKIQILTILVTAYFPLFLAYGAYVANDDKIINEDDKHIYVMRYGLYNNDSTIVEYDKPKEFKAKVKVSYDYDRYLIQSLKNNEDIYVRSKEVELKVGKTYDFEQHYYPEEKIVIKNVKANKKSE